VFLHEAITTVASRRNEHDNTNLLRGGHRREVVKPGDTGNAARAAEGFADGMHVRDASGLDGWQSCRLEERSRQSIGRHARGEHHHAGIIPYKRVGRLAAECRVEATSRLGPGGVVSLGALSRYYLR